MCFVKYIPCLRPWVQSYPQCRALSHWEEPSPLRQKTWKSMSGTSHKKNTKKWIFDIFRTAIVIHQEKSSDPRGSTTVSSLNLTSTFGIQNIYTSQWQRIWDCDWALGVVNPPAMRGERDFPDSSSSFLVLMFTIWSGSLLNEQGNIYEHIFIFCMNYCTILFVFFNSYLFSSISLAIFIPRSMMSYH